MQNDLFGKPYEPGFDGKTYVPERDWYRLTTQLGRVFSLMRDGRWRSLREIADHAQGSEASVSARLRDLRKDKFGSHVVERKNITGGLYKYRLLVNTEVDNGV